MHRLLRIKNRRTNESQVLTLDEFNKKFANELESAIAIYSQQEANRMLLFPFAVDNRNYKAEFYFELRWNFNYNTNSEWFIEKFIR